MNVLRGNETCGLLEQHKPDLKSGFLQVNENKTETIIVGPVSVTAETCTRLEFLLAIHNNIRIRDVLFELLGFD